MRKRRYHELQTDIDNDSDDVDFVIMDRYSSTTSSTISSTRKKSCVAWNCLYCEYQNHPSTKTCVSCQAWRCHECNIVNPPCESQCTQCKNHSQKEQHNASSPAKQWQCDRCTMLNNNEWSLCEVCHSRKPERNEPPGWPCTVCTFRNVPTANICEICNTQRSSDLSATSTRIDNDIDINDMMQNDDDENDIDVSMPSESAPISASSAVNDESVEIDDEIMRSSLTALKRFGHERFRPSQYAVIQNLIQGENTMLILPTGGGKSICFQVPILVLNQRCNEQQKHSPIQAGIGIIISPLISLMNDQICKLKHIGIQAEFINSSLTQKQRKLIEQRLRRNEIEMLYVAPELFTSKSSDSIINLINQHRIITLFVIDEAHCISAWGHNFRPSYTKLARIIDAFNDPVVMICTATATQKVREDILEQLHLDEHRCKIHIASFDRPNIFLKAVNMRRERRDLEQVILNEIELFHRQRGHDKDAVIVYCGTQKETEKTCEFLQKHQKQCGNYHAGLGDKQRKDVQYDFMNGTINIITATNAFGMGIDKDNVGLIIHKTSPASIEAYYQQIGRAGRNGQASKAVILYGHSGKEWIADFSQFIVDNENPSCDVVRTVARVICNQYEINEQQSIRLNDILNKTGYSFNDHVTSQTVSKCIRLLEQYGVLTRIKSDLLPLRITFSPRNDNSRDEIRQNTIHWRLWNEIVDRQRNENNEIQIIIVQLIKRLRISSKELTKSLQYLKSKKLILYENLRRAGAIILLSDEFERKVDWDEVEKSRETAVENERKMKQLINTRGCRRRLLLQHFDQRYVQGSNPRCCDNCNRSIN